MQIYKDLYPARTSSSDPAYPGGKAVDAVAQGSGTPVTAAWVNDLWGAFQAILDDAGGAPNATAEKVGSSQVLDSLKQIGARNGVRVFDSQSNMVAGTLSTGDTVAHHNKALYVVYSGGNLAFYVVQNEGEIALGGGLYAKRQNAAPELRLESFGMPPTPQSIADAIDAAVEAGAVLVGGSIETTEPIVLKSGLMLRLDVVNNTAETSPTNGIFTGGELDLPATTGLTYYPINDTTARDPRVSFSTIGQGASFSEGELVFLRGGSYYTSGTNRTYEMMMLNEIAEINGDDVRLAYPVPRGVTGAELASADHLAIKNVDVRVGRAYATGGARAKLFRQSGGMLRSSMRFEFVDADSVFFTNTFTGCVLECDTCKFDRHVYELACGSFANRVHISTAQMVTAGSAGKRSLRVSESSAFNKVRIDELDMSEASADGSAMMYIEGYSNFFDIGVLTGREFTGDAIRFITQAFAFTGTPHDIEDNYVKIGRVYASGELNNVITFVDDTVGHLKNNTVELVEFADAPVSSFAVKFDGIGNKVIGGRFKYGGLYVATTSSEEYIAADFDNYLFNTEANNRRHLYDLRFPKWRALRDFAAREGFMDLINPAGTETTVISKTLTAGTVVQGDKIALRCGGELLGEINNTETTGDHAVEVRINGTVIASVNYAADESGSWLIDLGVFFDTITAVQFAGTAIGVTTEAVCNGATIDNIELNDVTVEIAATHDSGNADRFRLRFAEVKLDLYAWEG